MEDLLEYVKALVIEKGNMHYQKELMKYMMQTFEPSINDKKKYGEVNTPESLRNDMLSTLMDYDATFFNTVKTVFEPCCGKGLFLLDIIDRFMEGLSNVYSDIHERYKIIVEQCVYFADINPMNIDICRIIIDPFSQYSLQCYLGDVLNVTISTVFQKEYFYAIISNPPYNALGKTGTGNAIWQHFVKKALYDWRCKYLVFVHPPGWRKPPKQDSKYNGLFEDLTRKNNMLYLEMHDVSDGLKVFGCGTRYDWYIVKSQESKNNDITKVKDYKNIIYNLHLQKFYFLPNYNINDILKYVLDDNDDKTVQVLYSRTSYASDKKWISHSRNDIYTFPIIHSTPRSGVRILYSKKDDNGHFNIPKLIFGDSGIYNAIIDERGEYGLSEHAIGFTGYTIEEMNAMKKIIETNEFSENILKPCMWSNYQIDWRLFTYFKRNFYDIV